MEFWFWGELNLILIPQQIIVLHYVHEGSTGGLCFPSSNLWILVLFLETLMWRMSVSEFCILSAFFFFLFCLFFSVRVFRLCSGQPVFIGNHSSVSLAQAWVVVVVGGVWVMNSLPRMPLCLTCHQARLTDTPGVNGDEWVTIATAVCWICECEDFREGGRRQRRCSLFVEVWRAETGFHDLRARTVSVVLHGWKWCEVFMGSPSLLTWDLNSSEMSCNYKQYKKVVF